MSRLNPKSRVVHIHDGTTADGRKVLTCGRTVKVARSIGRADVVHALLYGEITCRLCVERIAARCLCGIASHNICPLHSTGRMMGAPPNAPGGGPPWQQGIDGRKGPGRGPPLPSVTAPTLAGAPDFTSPMVCDQCGAVRGVVCEDGHHWTWGPAPDLRREFVEACARAVEQMPLCSVRCAQRVAEWLRELPLEDVR